MSGSHGHDHGHDSVEDDHDDDHHDLEPPPDEPESPGWLPLLGGGLLLLALLLFLVMRSPEAEEAAAEPGTADVAAAQAAPDASADPHEGHDHD